MKYVIASIVVVVTSFGCGRNGGDRPTTPSNQQVTDTGDLSAEQDDQVTQNDSVVIFTKATNDMTIASLPDGAQVCFGRSLIVPIPAVKLVEQESEPGHFRQVWQRLPIRILNGRFYQKLGDQSETEYTDLESGDKLTPGQLQELSGQGLEANWDPIRPSSMDLFSHGQHRSCVRLVRRQRLLKGSQKNDAKTFSATS